MIRYLHKPSHCIVHQRRFARNASYERSWFWRITIQAHPKKVVVVALVHHISSVTIRAGPSKLVGGLVGTVDVVVDVLDAALHHNIHRQQSRPARQKTRLAASLARRSGPYSAHISWAAARPGPSNVPMMGRGSARPNTVSEDGPRPGPGHHLFSFSRPGPARSIHFSNISTRPSPARPITF